VLKGSTRIVDPGPSFRRLPRHVTSSMTPPIDAPWALFYGSLLDTNP